MCPQPGPSSMAEVFLDLLENSSQLRAELAGIAEGARGRAVLESERFEDAAVDTLALRRELAAS